MAMAGWTEWPQARADHGNGRGIHVFGSWLRPIHRGNSAQRAYTHSPTSTMKRSGSGPRTSSPTSTTFSGISSYRTDSYKPLRDKASVSSPPLEPHLVARTHYEELSKYLVSYLAKGFVPSSPPFVHSHTIRSLRTCQLSLDCTTETHTAHSPAIPRTLHRCLR
jgi:hypothetical protein